MLRSFNGTIDAEIAESKLNQRLSQQARASTLLSNASRTLTQGSDGERTSEPDSFEARASRDASNVSATASANVTMTSNKFEALQNQREKKN